MRLCLLAIAMLIAASCSSLKNDEFFNAMTFKELIPPEYAVSKVCNTTIYVTHKVSDVEGYFSFRANTIASGKACYQLITIIGTFYPNSESKFEKANKSNGYKFVTVVDTSMLHRYPSSDCSSRFSEHYLPIDVTPTEVVKEDTTTTAVESYREEKSPTKSENWLDREL